MAQLPTELYHHCRSILLKCSELDSNRSLQTVFVTAELGPFQNGLPQAISKTERVDVVLDYVSKQRLSDGRSLLPLFLAALRDRYHLDNIIRDELETIWRKVEDTLDVEIDDAKSILVKHKNVTYVDDNMIPVVHLLNICQKQVERVLHTVRFKYDPELYVNRDIEHDIKDFFDPFNVSTSNCYLLVAPAGSGKTNLACSLAQSYVTQQPVLLLMGRTVYLNKEKGFLGLIQSELQTVKDLYPKICTGSYCEI